MPMLESLKPPRGASLLLSLFSNLPDFKDIEGDLSEEFQQLALLAGPSAARQWYWSQTIRNSVALVARRESISALGAGLFSVALFSLVMPLVFQSLRFALSSLPRIAGARIFLMTLVEIVLSFVLGSLLTRVVKGSEPLLRLTFTIAYLVSLVSFIIRSGMYQWWSPFQFSLNFVGMICVIAFFWLGTLASERGQARLSVS
jgi:hypothetical protein